MTGVSFRGLTLLPLLAFPMLSGCEFSATLQAAFPSGPDILIEKGALQGSFPSVDSLCATIHKTSQNCVSINRIQACSGVEPCLPLESSNFHRDALIASSEVLPVPSPSPEPAGFVREEISTSDLCLNQKIVDLGELAFDEKAYYSNSVAGDAIAIATIHVPNRLPPGWNGLKSAISVFECGTGAFVWRKVFLSKRKCDFSVTQPSGMRAGGGDVTLEMNYAATGARNDFLPAGPEVHAQPGETWYLIVKHEYGTRDVNGPPSCGAGQNCDFCMRAVPPI